MVSLSIEIFDISFIARFDGVVEFISHLVKSIEFVLHVVNFYFRRELLGRDVVTTFLYSDLRLDLLDRKPIVLGLILFIFDWRI